MCTKWLLLDFPAFLLSVMHEISLTVCITQLQISVHVQEPYVWSHDCHMGRGKRPTGPQGGPSGDRINVTPSLQQCFTVARARVIT